MGNSKGCLNDSISFENIPSNTKFMAKSQRR